MKKETKPKYSTWQNIGYVLQSAWRRDRYVVFTMIAVCALIPAIPAVAMFLPKTVVALIMENAAAMTLISAVLAFTIAGVIMQSVKSYLDSTMQARRIGLRIWISHDIMKKSMETDYANIENKAFTDSKQRATEVTMGNSTATERIYYTLENIGSNILGLIIYVILLIQVNPLVLLLTAATAAFGFFIRRKANKWRHDHDEESTGYGKRTWYIANLGDKTALAKDIRLFALTGWLNDVYSSYAKLRHNWQRRVQTRQYLADAADCMGAFLRDGAAYAYLIWQVLGQNIAVDEFVLLFAAIAGFSGWVTGILSDCATLQRQSLDYCRLREYLEFPDSFKREDGEPVVCKMGKTHSLELRNVSFRYVGADEDTLQNINLTIKAGEKLAIVGLNGAGKTSLVKLLCGFYDPIGGEVLLDGKDIRVRQEATSSRNSQYSLELSHRTLWCSHLKRQGE